MKKLSYIIWLIVALIIATFVYQQFNTNTSQNIANNEVQREWWYNGKIKVWHLVALDMAPMFIAKEAWFFADEWLDIETVFFSNPWDNNAALVWWDLQFHINPFTLPFLGQNQWSPMRIISSAWWREIIEVVIQWEYWVDTVKDLKSWVEENPWKKLKIWTLKGDTLDMIIYRSLLEEGLSYDDFEMVWFNDLLAMVQSFQSKQIDILSHIKPYTTDLILNYDAKVLTNNDTIWWRATPNTTTVAMEWFLEKYPETVKAYLRAQQKWFQFIVDNPEQAVELLEKGQYYKVDSDVLLFAFKNQPKDVILKPNIDGMMIAIDDMVDQWYIEPVDRSVVNTSFLDALWIK